MAPLESGKSRWPYEFEPEPRIDDLLAIAEHAEALGYTMLQSAAQYSLEQVQATLREIGPSAFLNIIRVSEDISPRAPLPTVEDYIGQRLAVLARQADLVITDPYIFTRSRRKDPSAYAQSAGRLITPLHAGGASLTLIADSAASDAEVQEAVTAELALARPSLRINVIDSNSFHDRLWIADRARGIIMGTSLNKIGSKIFFMDTLSESDVDAITNELAAIGV